MKREKQRKKAAATQETRALKHVLLKRMSGYFLEWIRCLIFLFRLLRLPFRIQKCKIPIDEPICCEPLNFRIHMEGVRRIRNYKHDISFNY